MSVQNSCIFFWHGLHVVPFSRHRGFFKEKTKQNTNKQGRSCILPIPGLEIIQNAFEHSVRWQRNMTELNKPSKALYKGSKKSHDGKPVCTLIQASSLFMSHIKKKCGFDYTIVATMVTFFLHPPVPLQWISFLKTCLKQSPLNLAKFRFLPVISLPQFFIIPNWNSKDCSPPNVILKKNQLHTVAQG